MDSKFFEKKHPTISAFPDNFPQFSKKNSFRKILRKESAIKFAVAKNPIFEDLWSKYKANSDEIHKAKEAFLKENLNDKNKNLSVFFWDSQRVSSQNIQYNPFVFIGFVCEDLAFSALQVSFPSILP